MNLVTQVEITINGEGIKTFQNLSLQQSVFGHHALEIVCQRDTLEDEGSLILDQTDKYLGGEILLKLISDKDEMHEFKGIVTQVSATKVDGPFGGNIVIHAESPDVLLDDGDHCRSFEEKSLDKIVKQVLKDYNFSTNLVKPQNSTDTLPYTVQYKESAYAFITRLAAKKGEWFFYNGTDLVFGALPKKSVDIHYGKDLTQFDFSMKLDDMKFKYLAYDYLKRDIIEKKSAGKKPASISKKAKVALKKSDELYTHETTSLYNNAVSEKDPANHLDKRVEMIKKAMAAGLVDLSGNTDNPNLTIGCEVNILEVINTPENKGKKVEHGKYIITSISHSIDRTGNYQNSFQAVPSEIDLPPYSSPHAIPFCETQSAKVMDNNDPEKLGRIRVQFPWQEPGMSPWVRVITPHSGEKKGFYFIPEIDDEVLVAFEGGNAEKPYIIGSLYHGKAKPETLTHEENDIKAIRTRSGHTIEFIDTDGSEELKIYDHEKDNYVITLSTHEKKITVASTGNIEMKAEGDFEIEAVGDLKVKANNITMESNQDFSMKTTNMKIEAASEYEAKGMNVKTNADAQMELKAGATMDVQASAKMTLNGGGLLEQKGGLIKIN
jgi:Rhs element Vgr protein